MKSASDEVNMPDDLSDEWVLAQADGGLDDK